MKQIGITSFGLAFGCELGLHAAFTRTSMFISVSGSDIYIVKLIYKTFLLL